MVNLDKVANEFDEKKLARENLKFFMLYTDPYAQSPSGSYQLKEFHKKMIDVLEKVESGEIKRLMINVPPQHGKQIANSEPVFTTNGRKKHGDLHVGDYVFSPEGKAIAVQGETSETQSEYRVTFSNGQTIDCHGNHEWVLSKNKYSFKVYETKEIFKDYTRKEGNKTRFVYRLPHKKPIELEDKELSIDPYLLGFWLGDGKSSAGSICSPKQELNTVLEKILSKGYNNGSVWSHNDYDCDYTTILGLQTKLKELGLYNNKHIPEAYLIGSIKQRLELLAGLIDSDGAVFNDKRWNSGSRVTFTNTNKDLIDGIEFICNSMGRKTYNFKTIGEAHDNIVPKKLCYQISFNPTCDIPVTLERKKINPIHTHRHISITNIEKLEGLEMGKCIQVEGGVYLVGKTMIPTHNSSVSSIGFPAWTLGKNPYQNVVLCSYSAELSEGFSRKTREILRDPLYKKLFGDILSPDSQSITEWNTTKGGGYRAVGVGGSLTGKSADKIIIDDPHKDQEEAQSGLIRNKVRDWYRSVPLTRAHDNTAIIIIMTRWHEDDLCGRLLETERDGWHVLNIPVINPDGTVIRPEKHSRELIDKKRQTMGEAMFQALYMGDPINEGGGDFKQEYFQHYDKEEIFDYYGVNYIKDLQVVTFIDPAISQKQTADSTAIVTVGLDKKNNNVYVIDIRHGKMLPDEIINNVFNVVNEFRPQKVGIETNQFQKMLKIEIEKEMRKRNTFFVLEGQTSSMNKEAKIRSVLQNRYANAAILHQKRGLNVNELEAQMLKFPNGKHDDIVDCLSMAIMMLSSVGINKSKAKVVKANRI